MLGTDGASVETCFEAVSSAFPVCVSGPRAAAAAASWSSAVGGSCWYSVEERAAVSRSSAPEGGAGGAGGAAAADAGEGAVASGADMVMMDLKRLFLCLAPNMILPRLEKETAGRSSQRQSSGMGVLMIGAKDFASADGVATDVKGAAACALSGLAGRGPDTCGGGLLLVCGLGVLGVLATFGDLAEPRSGSISWAVG